MSISVRLDKELEQALRIQAARAEVVISAFIRETIKEKTGPDGISSQSLRTWQGFVR
jgi:plasmid stability protein